MAKLRSSEWFDGRDELGFQHRAAIRSVGIQIERSSRKPVIGIANSWSELNNCNITLRDLAGHVRRGVEEAGGIALEFPTISLGEEFMKPTAMLYRNLMAMDVEETLRSNPLDGVVLLSNCDKTGPAQLMGAASANLPAIQLNAGPRRAYAWKEQEIGSGTDLWKYWDEYRKGSISGEDWKELESCMARSVGACNVMGTASTMAAIAEALGIMLPATSTITADEKDRQEAAFATGRAAVRLVELDLRPRDILTEAAFRNAIRVCMAVGGSTNAIIHLVAIAGRCGISLPLDLFDEIGRSTPCLANLKPSGKYLVHHFHAAGGVPAVLQRLGALIDGSAMTVTGETLERNLERFHSEPTDVIRPVSDPIVPQGSLAVLRGNLAPGGAILKVSAATPRLLEHTGSAIVFEDYADMLRRVDDPNLEVDASSVLVLKHIGPRAVPGMPEWGSIPIPGKLLREGVTDIVRISDGRMSGTSYGTVILHVSPEAAAIGPLAAVRTGDQIRLSVAARRVDLLVPEGEIQKRLEAYDPPRSRNLRGYPRLYIDHVLQAEEGCDFDFLRPRSQEELEFIPPVVGRS